MPEQRLKPLLPNVAPKEKEKRSNLCSGHNSWCPHPCMKKEINNQLAKKCKMAKCVRTRLVESENDSEVTIK